MKIMTKYNMIGIVIIGTLLCGLYSCAFHADNSLKLPQLPSHLKDYFPIIKFKGAIAHLQDTLQRFKDDEIYTIGFDSVDSVIVTDTEIPCCYARQVCLKNITNVHSLLAKIATVLRFEELVLSNCSFVMSEKTASRMRGLREITFINCSELDLTTLPYLTQIHVLNFDSCSIRKFPDNFADNFSLDTLNIRMPPYMKTLPANVDKIPNLHYIGLGEDQSNKPNYDDIFGKVSQCKRLQILTMIGFDRPSSEKMRDLSVKELSLVFCKYDIVPKQVYGITSLKSLNLRENNITSLPVELSRMPNLRGINLLGNPIKSIPDSLQEYFKHITFEFGN